MNGSLGRLANVVRNMSFQETHTPRYHFREPSPRPDKSVVRWHGTIPAQKWTNFYMKVLTRFASFPDLKIEVPFEVPLAPGQAETKADEARTGLKELGLEDDVEATCAAVRQWQTEIKATRMGRDTEARPGWRRCTSRRKRSPWVGCRARPTGRHSIR